MSDIRAVVFDIGRVLIQWDLRCLFRHFYSDPDELEWFVSNVVTEEWHFQHDQGRRPDDMVAERVAEFPDHAEAIHAYATRFNETIPGPVPGSLEIVEDLAGQGTPLFAITNFGHEFWHGFRPTQPIFDHFGDIVVSGTEKLVKPGREIFDLAAERFGHEPAAMLFIDDNAANIAAAAELGWQVHHFKEAAALRADLEERGLLPA